MLTHSLKHLRAKHAIRLGSDPRVFGKHDSIRARSNDIDSDQRRGVALVRDFAGASQSRELERALHSFN